ncbi:TPR repeat protein [Rhodovulum sp. PH10]|uniref:tetratricopeptide repeat protein n=1 Tax=Rhodovulum sp. PH10 TaxID=1187851 RepID=UPI00027C2A6A|nr:tetratricopeptide repeat protein [Rhodovulum sp. PH10]EJW11231.1 TPR repeat protein [Rhodovulum sp. PH10]
MRARPPAVSASVVLAVSLGLVAAAPPAVAASFSEALTRQLSAPRNDPTTDLQKGAVIDEEGVQRLLPEGADRRSVLKMRATIYERVGDVERAEADLTAALAITPVEPSLYADRGYFYLRHQRYADAVADFVAGARLAPREAVFPYAVGRVQARMGDHERAVASYGEALRLDSEDGRVLIARAEAYVHLGHYAEARDDYTRALRTPLDRPGDRYFAFVGRGYTGLVLHDYDAAVKDFDQALALEPNAFNALAWRGFANEKRGRTDLAIADLERVVAADPSDAEVRSSLRRLRSK